MHKPKLWQLIIAALCLVCLIISLIIFLNCKSRINELDHQALAARWSDEGGYAQESVFYSMGSGFTADDILGIRATTDTALTAASIEGSYQDGTWFDAYSADISSTLSVESGASCAVTMTAVGGDFFRFHPLHLISGSYIAESDLMHDLIIIDELTAWNLFGSNDCVGMTVKIDGLPYIVSGVVEAPSGNANEEAADMTVARAYMSFDACSDELTAQCYEALAPNPIPGFAKDMVAKSLSADEKASVAVENTGRYDVEEIFGVLKNMPTRSMQTITVAYPYWENAARLTETRLAFEYTAIAVLLLIPAIWLVILLVILWHRKKWRFSDVKNYIGDKIYAASCRRAADKRQPKHLKVRKTNEKTIVCDEHPADAVDDPDHGGM